MIRVGGGYEPFQEYLIYNQNYFQRMIIVHMIKSGLGIDQVISMLLKGERIRNIYQEAQQTRLLQSKFKRSVSRGSSGYGASDL